MCSEAWAGLKSARILAKMAGLFNPRRARGPARSSLQSSPYAAPARLLQCSAMTVRIYSNGRACPLGPFVERFTGNVCRSVVDSLKGPGSAGRLRFDLDGDRVALAVDGVPVALDRGQGFAGTIARDTLRGMVRHLKGVDPDGPVRIEVDP